MSEEEKKTVEDEVNTLYFKELKEEIDKLKDKVEEMTMKVEEESKKRVKAETEVKREKEMVDNLMRILLKRSYEGSGARKEEALGSRETMGRRGECRNPVVEEEVRTKVCNQQQEQGFLQPPAMVRGVRYTMVGGQQSLWGVQQPLWGHQQHLWGGQQPMVAANQQPLYGHHHGWRWVRPGWLVPQL